MSSTDSSPDALLDPLLLFSCFFGTKFKYIKGLVLISFPPARVREGFVEAVAA
jgi:hypothetical protein